jgi:hypothetical protein
VAGHAEARVAAEAVPELRRQPGPVPGEPLPASFLKHADEQTVAGLTAVYRAVHDHALGAAFPQGFRDWGVVAGPRFLGRPAMAASLQRYLAEGAWGVSPHMIPHRSLHSISGTVSQALKVHGPNFGVGGGPGCEAEALLVATALLERRRLPGVWVVLTRLDPELPPDDSGRPTPGTFCQALALALVPARDGWPGLRLRLSVEPRAGEGPAGVPPAPAPAFGLDTLLSLLRQVEGGAGPAAAPLGGARVELTKPAAASAAGPVLLPGPGLRAADPRPRRSA